MELLTNLRLVTAVTRPAATIMIIGLVLWMLLLAAVANDNDDNLPTLLMMAALIVFGVVNPATHDHSKFGSIQCG